MEDHQTGTSTSVFGDRREAGRVLARQLEHYRGRSDVVVLALPRGGVPVAHEVALALGAPLDVFVVRKLGVPGHEELAMGAIASGGVVVLNDDVVRGLGIDPDVVAAVAEREGPELARRERLYREGGPPPGIAGNVVILVDDGLATGSSMRAAVQALQALGGRRPSRIVVAVPVAPESTCRELATEVDEVVCATTPSPFFAVGQAYWDFEQTTDDEVRELLRAARAARPRGAVPNGPGDGAVNAELVPMRGVETDYDALLEAVANAHLVLLGEASHGTHEFYEERARITRRLIEEKGFHAVAAEADWPDAYRVNRFVHGRSLDVTAEEALGGFERFPTWMWRNAVVADFVGWLRERNSRVADKRAKVGFYGLDLYSLFRSIHEIIAYLDRVDPAAATRARARYACFDQFREDPEAYGYLSAFGAGDTCEREVVDQLVDLQRHALEYARRDGRIAEDDLFYAEQNARTVKAAEAYYRTMLGGRVPSWNLRDRHMADTLEALAGHLTHRHGEQARIVVWAHNSHLGDARMTEMGNRGELNVGQLVRERHPGDCTLVGFTTYEGTVTAADDWGGPVARKQLRPALPGSFERLLHEASERTFLLPFSSAPRAAETLRSTRLERAVGVIYRPDSERQSHYFSARLAEQFDVVVHIDQTRALEPLERTGRWEQGEVPETYPHTV
jgi:erythromycin esterase-like protein/predicted phosphoribosyltransferase